MIKIKINKKLINWLSRVIFASLVASNLLLSTSHADTILGSDVEVGVWSPTYDSSVFGKIDGDSQSVFASATLEHPIPLVPNIKISVSEINSEFYEYTKVDYTAYYEIVDNDYISLDLGMGVSQFDGGELISQVFTEVKPHIYIDAEVALPIPNTTLYTDIHFLKYEGEKLNDVMAGLRYDLDLEAAEVGLKAGYRVHILEDDFGGFAFDVKNDGYFLGLHADF